MRSASKISVRVGLEYTEDLAYITWNDICLTGFRLVVVSSTTSQFSSCLSILCRGYLTSFYSVVLIVACFRRSAISSACHHMISMMAKPQSVRVSSILKIMIMSIRLLNYLLIVLYWMSHTIIEKYCQYWSTEQLLYLLQINVYAMCSSNN